MRVRLAAGLTAALLAGACAALAPVPASAATTDCSPTGRVSDVGGSWLALQPAFTAGPAEVALAAAPAFAPDLLYASNGVQVARSVDGGCAWKVVLDVSSAGGTEVVRSLSAPSSANATRQLYVAVDSDRQGIARPSVRVSPDRGETWVSASDGLPPVGSVQSLTASPRLPQTAYALIRQRVADRDLTSAVWATTDGGRTWQQRTPAGTRAALDQLQASPQRDNDLLGLGAGTVQVSTDGGRSFSTATPPGPADVVALDAAGGGGGTRVIAGRSGGPATARSDDGGATWTPLASPVTATRVAMAPLQDLVAVGDERSTWLLSRRLGRMDVTPEVLAPSQLQLTAPTEAGFALTGVSAGAVVRSTYTLDSLRPRPTPTPVRGRLQPFRLLPFDPRDQFPSTLTPVRKAITLPRGGSTVIPYQLLLPRTPSPLDVMFLVDTTGSMGGVINGLRDGLGGIVNALNTSGLDVRVGLGSFKDYPSPEGGGGTTDYPYRLDRRIGIADEDLAQAIRRLSASGGGDFPESSLTALYQSATGKGEVVDGREYVKPGGQAGFRSRTVRLAVLATDAPFHQRGERDFANGGVSRVGYTMDQTVAVLRARAISVVGLAASSAATTDLSTVAEGSGAIAPDGGVDCDGNASVDVREGDPLVCPIGDDVGAAAGGAGVGVGVGGTNTGTDGGAVNLSGAVIGLAEALPDLQRVTLRVTRGDRYAQVLGAAVRNRVNLKADNELAFGVRVTCPLALPAGRQVLALAGQAAGRTVAAAAIDLTCTGAAPAPIAAPGPSVAEPLAGAAAAPGGGPATPNVNPNPNPNPNPNVNPNANPHVNANPGTAAQEQQIQQLALVNGELDPTDAQQLAMSGTASVAFVGTAGLLFVVAACLAVRPRRALALSSCR